MEAEAGRSLSLMPAWSTEQVPGQPGLHREILSQKTNKQQQQQKMGPGLAWVLGLGVCAELESTALLWFSFGLNSRARVLGFLNTRF